MSNLMPLASILRFVLVGAVCLLSCTVSSAQAVNTTFGCYVASPPHSLVSPGDVRIVSNPSDCVAGETGISWDVFPVAGVKPRGVVFDGANIWVLSTGNFPAPGTVTKLRASDGANLGTFPAGQAPEKGIFDGHNIWVTNRPANTLTKLRASDGSLVATIPVRQGPAGLAFDGTNIWVSYYLGNSVSKIRPSDGAELSNTPGISSPLEVLFDGTNIWAANNLGGGNVTKINGNNGAILGVFNTNGGFPAILAHDGSNLWVPNSGSQNLSKVRGSDGVVVGSFPMGFGAAGIAFDGTNVWVANEAVVLKYRASDGALLGSFPGSFNGSGVYQTAVTFDGTYVWVANFSTNTVTRYLDGALDTIAPTTSTASNPAANTESWNNSDVGVSLSATDNANGSGVSEITYNAIGAQTIAPTTVTGASADLLITAEGETIITYFAKDAAGNTESAQTLVVRIDKSAPSISCASADGAWHASDVSIPCSARDIVSGLSNAADSSFNVYTNVPTHSETANASTNSRTVCDLADNCATAGPISGNKVDKKAPTITITTPSTSAVYLLNQAVASNYTCYDGGSGGGSCTGLVESGSNIDTASPGSKSFTVNATDQVENTAAPQSVSYSVGYGVVALYDQTKVHRSGSTIPIKIQIVDVNGVNYSSASLPVQAMSVVLVSSNTSGTPEDAGNANPDLNFRYDASLGGYIFNLQTTGYAAGTYELHFVVAGDTSDHVVQFRIRP